MRYMMFIKHTEDYRNAEVPASLYEEMGEFVEETTKSGNFVSGAGLQPTSTGTRVRLAGGKIKVMDGPFTESKEIVGGYAIMDAKSREEALAWRGASWSSTGSTGRRSRASAKCAARRGGAAGVVERIAATVRALFRRKHGDRIDPRRTTCRQISGTTVATASRAAADAQRCRIPGGHLEQHRRQRSAEGHRRGRPNRQSEEAVETACRSTRRVISRGSRGLPDARRVPACGAARDTTSCRRRQSRRARTRSPQSRRETRGQPGHGRRSSGSALVRVSSRRVRLEPADRGPHGRQHGHRSPVERMKSVVCGMFALKRKNRRSARG